MWDPIDEDYMDLTSSARKVKKIGASYDVKLF